MTRSTALAHVTVIAFVLISLPFGGDVVGQIHQHTAGDCSPAVTDVAGSVTVNCNVGGRRSPVPAFVGDFYSQSSDLNRLVPFMRAHVNAITYIKISFAMANYRGEEGEYCEEFRASKRDMYLQFENPKAVLILKYAQKIQNEDSGYACVTCNPNRRTPPDKEAKILETCMDPKDAADVCVNGLVPCTPCNHGFCQVTGFFIPQEAGTSEDYLFLSLRQLETSEVLLSPNYDVPH
jgi:hypothetical protein